MSIDRFLAVRNFAFYRDRVMYRLRFTVMTTVANYMLTTLAYFPLFFLIVYDGEVGLCGYREITSPVLQFFQVVSYAAMVYRILPLFLVLSLTIFVATKHRGMLVRLRDSEQLSSEDTASEVLMTTGTIISGATFFFFSGLAIAMTLVSALVTKVVDEKTADPVEKNLILKLFVNIGVLLTTFNMTVAFVLFAVQNQQFRASLKKAFDSIYRKFCACNVDATKSLHKQAQDGAGSDNEKRPSNDNHGIGNISINRMPANQSSESRVLQIQLRKLIQLEHGSPNDAIQIEQK
ncbi:uncharacterized protein LOC134856650 [Symsagittifera roscoffensis]|uniref:uncharacterized protein LOC134856650 n=1 Tax=Symsagittifera roscoffensis TaxID=84072 RepID=UPI00307B8288